MSALTIELTPLDSLLFKMEEWMLPSPDTIRWSHGNLEPEVLSLSQKISHYALHTIQMIGAVLALPFVAIYSAVNSLFRRSVEKIDVPPAHRFRSPRFFPM